MYQLYQYVFLSPKTLWLLLYTINLLFDYISITINGIKNEINIVQP